MSSQEQSAEEVSAEMGDLVSTLNPDSVLRGLGFEVVEQTVSGGATIPVYYRQLSPNKFLVVRKCVPDEWFVAHQQGTERALRQHAANLPALSAQFYDDEDFFTEVVPALRQHIKVGPARLRASEDRIAEEATVDDLMPQMSESAESDDSFNSELSDLLANITRRPLLRENGEPEDDPLDELMQVVNWAENELLRMGFVRVPDSDYARPPGVEVFRYGTRGKMWVEVVTYPHTFNSAERYTIREKRITGYTYTNDGCEYPVISVDSRYAYSSGEMLEMLAHVRDLIQPVTEASRDVLRVIGEAAAIERAKPVFDRHVADILRSHGNPAQESVQPSPDAGLDTSTVDDLLSARAGACPGCGSQALSAPDDEGLVDCLGCGIWFDPLHPDNQKPVAESADDTDPDDPMDVMRESPEHYLEDVLDLLRHTRLTYDLYTFWSGVAAALKKGHNLFLRVEHNRSRNLWTSALSYHTPEGWFDLIKLNSVDLPWHEFQPKLAAAIERAKQDFHAWSQQVTQESAAGATDPDELTGDELYDLIDPEMYLLRNGFTCLNPARTYARTYYRRSGGSYLRVDVVPSKYDDDGPPYYFYMFHVLGNWDRREEGDVGRYSTNLPVIAPKPLLRVIPALERAIADADRAIARWDEYQVTESADEEHEERADDLISRLTDVDQIMAELGFDRATSDDRTAGTGRTPAVFYTRKAPQMSGNRQVWLSLVHSPHNQREQFNFRAVASFSAQMPVIVGGNATILSMRLARDFQNFVGTVLPEIRRYLEVPPVVESNTGGDEENELTDLINSLSPHDLLRSQGYVMLAKPTSECPFGVYYSWRFRIRVYNFAAGGWCAEAELVPYLAANRNVPETCFEDFWPKLLALQDRVAAVFGTQLESQADGDPAEVPDDELLDLANVESFLTRNGFTYHSNSHVTAHYARKHAKGGWLVISLTPYEGGRKRAAYVHLVVSKGHPTDNLPADWQHLVPANLSLSYHELESDLQVVATLSAALPHMTRTLESLLRRAANDQLERGPANDQLERGPVGESQADSQEPPDAELVDSELMDLVDVKSFLERNGFAYHSQGADDRLSVTYYTKRHADSLWLMVGIVQFAADPEEKYVIARLASHIGEPPLNSLPLAGWTAGTLALRVFNSNCDVDILSWLADVIVTYEELAVDDLYRI